MQAYAVAGAQWHHTIAPLHVHVLRINGPAPGRVQQALTDTGLFTFVEQDLVAHATLVPNDPDFASEWHLSKIQAPGAWDITTGSTGVTIAVIDSGVDSTHPDLESKLVSGWSFLTGTSNTADTTGHGTAVSGTAAAATNNGTGVSGVAWANPVMPLAVVDSTGFAYYSDMASAITYAADHGARIVNMSLAGSSPSSTLQSAVDYAWNKGTVIFAAAGNYSTSTLYYPAACDNVVAVSSTGPTDVLSSFSDYGDWIDLAAPGESILTTTSGGSYEYWSGTSFSSPIAAAVGALVLSVQPSLSASGLVSLLEQNSDDLGTPGFDTSYGWGRINAYRAVVAAAGNPGDTTPPSVSISSPASSATVSSIIQIQGSATDNVGVTRIELWIDGALSTSATASPFSFSWDTSSVANGSHTITVKAYDAAGNVGQAAVTVTVSNTTVTPPDTQPPTVSITSPLSGSTIGLRTEIDVSASDNVAVAQVSIYVDGILLYTGTAAPYTYTWHTRKVAAGSHTITATAWDLAGNSASATPVTVFK